jgi:hypothetical protein
MFPKRWRVAEDRFYVHLAASPDGILWGFPPESQVLSPGERGAWDAGGVSVGCGLVELARDWVGAPFVGYRVPHKHPRRPPLGEIAWALWQKGRLIALEAEGIGEFRTMSVIPRSKPANSEGFALLLNARTHHVGEASVEALGKDGNPLAGRTFEDCDRICGDFLNRPVTWRGESRLNLGSGEPVVLRVRMAHAQLFSLTFVPLEP